MSKVKFIFALLFLFILFVVPLSHVLAESISGDNIVIESGETLDSTSFLSGENVRVDGDINGTTFVTAGYIEINGTIDGDLFVMGQSTVINGQVNGSVFIAGQDVTLNGVVENSIYLAGATVRVNSQTEGSSFLAGQNIFIDKEAVIKKDVFVGGASVYQNGVINGDLTSSSDSLTIGGEIDGNLTYSSQKKADLTENSQVRGETTWRKIEKQPTEDTSMALFTMAVLYKVLFSIGTALVIWLFVHLLRPTFWVKLATKLLQSPLKTLGFGAIAIFVIPLLAILLMLTVIGIPLSFIVLMLYGITVYVSKIIVSVSIGVWIQERLQWPSTRLFWLFLLALTIVSALGVIPIVGMITGVVTLLFGMGAVTLSILSERI